jgi:hypothetical protein
VAPEIIMAQGLFGQAASKVSNATTQTDINYLRHR